MAGMPITHVWITDNHNILAKSGIVISIPIGSDKSPSALEFLKAFKAGVELDTADAYTVARIAQAEDGDAGPKSWAPKWTAKRKKDHSTRLERIKEAITRKILADYENMLGRPILTTELTGYVGDDVNYFTLEAPALVRVVSTDEQDLFHQVDREWIDPYWNLELLEPHPMLKDAGSLWMFGRSYSLATGKSVPTNFHFA